LIDLDKLLAEDLEAGATLVVPSRQRATVLRLAHARLQLEQGRELWRTPDVLAFGTWLEREVARAAEAGTPVPRILRSAEEWLLWREAAADATEGTDVLLTDSLTESLQRAAYRLYEWRIPREALRRSATPESELLARALERFDERCAQRRAAGGHRAAELLQGWCPQRPLTFAGFTERSAARRALLDRWEAQGVPVREHVPVLRPGRAFLASSADADEEIALAAAWCRARLEADPRQRLLVIVPDLDQRRASVARVFEHALAPQGVLGTAPGDSGACFAIEGGEPLSRAPLVRHALLSLRLLAQGLDFPAFGGWLRSSFWSAPDPAARARLEIWLRTCTGPDATVGRLRTVLTAAPSSVQAPARIVLDALLEAERRLEPDRAASPARWAQRFDAALAALGWPGARPLTSGEQQTRVRFLECLDEFAELGPTLGELSLREAVTALEELAARIDFEPATGDPAVTLTASLTDPVVRYDGLWVTGLHAESWPPPVHFDPFIPLEAQRRAGIPHTSPAGVLRHARALLTLWHGAAGEVVLSYPRHGVEGEHLASPLLAEVPGIEPFPTESVSAVPLARAARREVALEVREDAAGEPLPRGITLPAGSRSIEYQSRCAFRAYAELRLGCTPVEVPRPGLDARDRGRLLHRTLELVWKRLNDSGRLRAVIESGELSRLIEECTHRALLDCFGEERLREQRRALLREQRRAAQVVRELCEAELGRDPFTVRHVEHRCTLEIAGARLTLCIDRIDELADGTRVIFDYKTGRPQPQDWLGERITHPQLLVYLAAVPERVSALATIHLVPSRVGYRGIADAKDRLPQVDALTRTQESAADAAWEAQTARWREYVERLAEDFVSGRAALDPVQYACRTCHLHAFCRIGQPDALAQDANGDE